MTRHSGSTAVLLLGVFLLSVLGCTLIQTPSVIKEPTTTASQPPSPTLDELKGYLLDLINIDRLAQGLNQVSLGSNRAAQNHAEDMFRHSYLSHWGRDGLKPYMRYTIAGGTNYSAENVSGVECPRNPDAAYFESTMFELLEEAQKGLMNSPGHRLNILNDWHTLVSLGVACDGVSCSVVQMFEGDYVRYTSLPEISGGVFKMAGELLDGFQPIQVDIWYDELPYPLTPGQLGSTRAYSTGQLPAAFIRVPLAEGYHYTEDSIDYTWSTEVDPYLVDPNTNPPRRLQERLLEGRLIEECENFPTAETIHEMSVPWVTAEEFELVGQSFRVEADLRGVQNRLGPGVYTVKLWGEKNGKSLALTNYAIFLVEG